MDERLVRIDEAASFIREKLGGRKPFALVVLGSGLGKLAVNALDSTKIGHKVVSGVKTVAKAAGEKVSGAVDVVKDAVSAFNKMQDKLKATILVMWLMMNMAVI